MEAEKSMDLPVVVAIDGPAASGKSSVARRLAADLGFLHVNTGAMYRAFTWQVLQNGIDPRDTDAVSALLETTQFGLDVGGDTAVILINGVDPGGALQEAVVAANVSTIAANPDVRSRLVAEQRALGEARSVVMEGRDIGTVVFPATPHKFFIDARPEIRQARREAQGLVDSIHDRDRQDTSRKADPLRPAEGAEIIDTSDHDLEAVLAIVKERLAAQGLPF